MLWKIPGVVVWRFSDYITSLLATLLNFPVDFVLPHLPYWKYSFQTMYTASGRKQIQIKSYDYHDRMIRWSWCLSAGYLGCASSRAETAGRRGQSRFRGRSRFRRSISFGVGSSGFGERHLENKIIFNFISFRISLYRLSLTTVLTNLKGRTISTLTWQLLKSQPKTI